MTQQTVYLLSAIVIVICVVLSLIAGKKKKIKNIMLPVTEIEVSVSEDILFPEVIKGTYRNREIELTDIKWESVDFKDEAGEYIFKPVSPYGYLLEDVSIKVKVSDIVDAESVESDEETANTEETVSEDENVLKEEECCD